MKIAKVQVKYRIHGYPIKYKTKTIKTELPVNEFGFTLYNTLQNVLFDYLKSEDANFKQIIWFRVAM